MNFGPQPPSAACNTQVEFDADSPPMENLLRSKIAFVMLPQTTAARRLLRITK